MYKDLKVNLIFLPVLDTIAPDEKAKEKPSWTEASLLRRSPYLPFGSRGNDLLGAIIHGRKTRPFLFI